MRKISIYFFILAVFTSITAQADEQISNEIIYRAAFGSAQDVRLLLDRGANPQAKNSVGQPLILIAAARNDDEAAKIVKALLDSGIDINSVNAKGETAIMVATRSGTPETLKTLLDYLPAMTAKDANGNDLKKIAEARGDKKISEIITKGVDEEEKRLKEHQSDEEFKKLIKDYSYLTCANQYLNYYVASGQNPNIDSIAFDRVVSENNKKINDDAKQIKQYFKQAARQLKNISYKTKQAITSELDNIGGVEERTVAGVGRDIDLKTRCRRIANLWANTKFK